MQRDGHVQLRRVAPRFRERLWIFVERPELDALAGCLHCLQLHAVGDWLVTRDGLIVCPEPGCDGDLLDLVADESEWAGLGMVRRVDA